MQLMDPKAQYQQRLEDGLSLQDAIIARIDTLLDHTPYILGPKVTEPEKAGCLCAGVDFEHCIAVASGTDALLIALKALGVDAGDEVIWFQQPAKIEAAISPRTKAIIPVSLYEQSADFPAINAIAERHGLSVIEDGAQSLGGRQHRQLSCSLGKIGTASFSHPKRSTAMALVALVDE